MRNVAIRRIAVHWVGNYNTALGKVRCIIMFLVLVIHLLEHGAGAGICGGCYNTAIGVSTLQSSKYACCNVAVYANNAILITQVGTSGYNSLYYNTDGTITLQ